MEKKPNVLIVHNYYQQSGGEDVVVANEKKLLEEHGHKVIFYSRSNQELKTLNFLQKLVLPFAVIFNIRTYREIRKIIQKEKIDIVHVHNTLTLISSSVYYAALSRNVPVVQTMHNFRLLCPGAVFHRDGHICEDCVSKGLLCSVKHKCYRQSRLQTLLCAASTKIHRMTGIYKKIHYICLTEFNKEKLLQLKQIDENRVFVKSNFTEYTGNVIPYKERKDQYVFAGRLEKLKGIDILLKAWKLLPSPAPRLVLCGTGPMEDWCRKYIEENHLDSVELRGFVKHEEVMKILGESKALIFPTQLYEGFPMTIVESYACGTPVLGSDMGNVQHLIHKGKTGYCFQHDSSHDLCVKVCKLRSEDMTKESLRYYTEYYGAAANYTQLLAIYDKALSNTGG